MQVYVQILSYQGYINLLIGSKNKPSLFFPVFDESGHFIIYPTMLGIKVVNTHTNKVVRLIGKTETHRFLNVDLYQGKPRRKALITLVCCVYKHMYCLLRLSRYILQFVIY